MLVAEMTRTLTCLVRDEPTRSISPVSSTRSSLACWRMGTLPISSRKMVPLSASSKRPMRSVRASVNAPFTCPKSSLSKVPSGNAPVLTATSGMEARARQSVQSLRDDLFAGAMFAGDQYVGVRRTDAGDGLQHGLHGGRGGDEFGPAFGAQQSGFGFQLLGALQGAMQFDLGAQDCQQALVLPGLLDEVASAAAHGFDRKSNVAPGRHDDDWNVAVEGDDFRKQVETFLAGGGVARVIQVDEDGVVELAGQSFANGRGRLCGIDHEAGGTQQQLDRFQNVRLIVGRQDAAGALAIARFAGGIVRRSRVGLALCSWQTVLPQGAVPSTAS